MASSTVSVRNGAGAEFEGVIHFSSGQATCRTCHKPTGVVRVTVEVGAGLTQSASRWAWAVCCVECHHWQCFESFGNEGPEEARRHGGSKK